MMTGTEMINEHAKFLSLWTKRFVWEENDARTDASVEVLVSPSIEDDIGGSQVERMLDISKRDVIAFLKLRCLEFTDAMTIEKVSIKINGDVEDTAIFINADIHLAE